MNHLKDLLKERYAFGPQLEFFPIRWFLKPTVNILIVADGSIQLGSTGFGLESVIDTLEKSRFYPFAADSPLHSNFVSFKITGADYSGKSVLGIPPMICPTFLHYNLML